LFTDIVFTSQRKKRNLQLCFKLLQGRIISLTQAEKILNKFRIPIIKLTKRNKALTHKRKIIVQEDGAIGIPLLAAPLLRSFGGKFFDMHNIEPNIPD